MTCTIETIGGLDCVLGDIVAPSARLAFHRKLLIFDTNIAIDYREQRVDGFISEVIRIANAHHACVTAESFVPSFLEVVLSSTGSDPEKEARDRCNAIVTRLKNDGIAGDFNIVASVIEDLINEKPRYSESEKNLSNFWAIARAVHRLVEADSAMPGRYEHKIERLSSLLISHGCLIPKLAFMVGCIIYYLHEHEYIYGLKVKEKVKESLGSQSANNITQAKEKKVCNNFARDISMYYLMSKLEKLNVVPMFMSRDYIFNVLLNEVIYKDIPSYGWVPELQTNTVASNVLSPLITESFQKFLSITKSTVEKINNLNTAGEGFISALS